MGRIKTFVKYILWIVGISLFTTFCTYVGFNATYKNIDYVANLPEGVKINMAQSTKVNGRIYGEITSTNENNLEGKYIKINIYTGLLAKVATKYIKIENTKIDEPKKFAAFFTADNINHYTVEIVEDSEEIQEDIEFTRIHYKDIFTDEELKGLTILALVIGLTYIV